MKAILSTINNKRKNIKRKDKQTKQQKPKQDNIEEQKVQHELLAIAAETRAKRAQSKCKIKSQPLTMKNNNTIDFSNKIIWN